MSKSRPQYATNISYPKPSWPPCNPEIESAALTLLQPLLQEIGDHRKNTSKRSRGRNRPKKLPRNAGTVVDAEPEVFKGVCIGLQKCWRQLEAQIKDRLCESDERIAVLFCCRKAIPEPAQVALLLLIAAAARSSDSNAIRLVAISEEVELSMASSLGLPRAALLGITEGNVRTRSLVEYLRNTIPPVEVPWLRDKDLSSYIPLKIDTTFVPIKNNSSKPSSAEKAGVARSPPVKSS